MSWRVEQVMRFVYLMAPVIALIVLLDVVINDPWPGPWGGLVWTLSKLGKTAFGVWMLIYSIRRLRGAPERQATDGAQ